MKLLLDENLSPSLGEFLASAGLDVVHVRELGLASASDTVVMQRAKDEGRIVVSADTDFGQLLADSGATLPSVILLRREVDRSAAAQAQLLLDNLDQVVEDLEAGSIVVLETTRVRIRRLPVRGDPR